ncbi:MAG: gliding motility protein GldC [Bacteroidota bacterium]|jgi:gliding motility-associated protein GldC|nr:gliding motility protein GldC [Bacteroidota bacterium]
MTVEKKPVAKTSQIRIDVHLDDENLPINIEWDADDADFDGKESAKGMMLSIFDGLQQNAMRIDLWTQDMNVEEMNLFMFQTLATMADTFEKATGNKELSDEMRDFVHHFGHKANVFGPDHQH